MPGKKTTKLWVPDDEVSPETLAKVRSPSWHVICVTFGDILLCLYLLHHSRDRTSDGFMKVFSTFFFRSRA